MIPSPLPAVEKQHATRSRLRRFALSVALGTLLFAAIISVLSVLFRQPTLYDTGWSLIAGGTILVVILIFIVTPSGRARTRLLLIASIEERNRIIPDEYHDVHAGAAFAALLTIAAGALLIVLANSLGQRTSSNASPPFVGSVRSPLETLHEVAQDWHDDAYLAELIYNLDNQEPYMLWAKYRTPSYPRQELSVWMSTAGEYKLYYHNYNTPVLPAPITPEDWTLDSPEAMTILATDTQVRQCLTISGRRTSLQLTRLEPPETGEVVWCLWVEGCEEKCVDAAQN